jgi:hypothetical protein
MSGYTRGMRGLLTAGAAMAFLGAVVCGASPEDIRDIRGPQFVAPTWLIPALVAGGVMLGLGAYRIWRRRRGRRSARALLPFELALRRLEGIRALMRPENAREFCIAVSGIVRSYIEQGFGVTATQRTTEEFLRDLLATSNAALADHRELLSEFLHQCDLVKFAGISPGLEHMESLHRSACAFVRATIKPEEAATIPGAAPSFGRQESA